MWTMTVRRRIPMFQVQCNEESAILCDCEDTSVSREPHPTKGGLKPESKVPDAFCAPMGRRLKSTRQAA